MKKLQAMGALLPIFATILLFTVPALAGDTEYIAISEITKDITQGTSGTFQFRATSPTLPATGNGGTTP
jgi:hypothetical protein